MSFKLTDFNRDPVVVFSSVGIVITETNRRSEYGRCVELTVCGKSIFLNETFECAVEHDLSVNGRSEVSL